MGRSNAKEGEDFGGKRWRIQELVKRIETAKHAKRKASVFLITRRILKLLLNLKGLLLDFNILIILKEHHFHMSSITISV